MLEQLTEVCAGISREELNQPAFAGLSVLSYPELHEDSIPHINNFRMCQRYHLVLFVIPIHQINAYHNFVLLFLNSMMETCGITEYSVNDLTAPTTKRLRRQLSGIINFAKFREERLALLADLTIQRDVLTEQRDRQSTKGT